MTEKELPSWEDALRSPDSRFFKADDVKCVARRTNSLYSQCFTVFAVATLVAAIVVPQYPNADRLLHPLVLLGQIRDWLLSPPARLALERQILWWIPGLIVGAAVLTLAFGIVFRPKAKSRRAAPERQRI